MNGARERAAVGTTARLMRSAAAADSARFPLAAFRERLRAHGHRSFAVERVPFADLDQWHAEPGTGNLRHRTGRFFTVEGLRRTAWGDPGPGAVRPVMVQPEIGVLGIVVKEFDGVLHLLLQAKAEPGNVPAVQLSPTVQATRSNSTRSHGGSAVRFLEYFTSPARGRVLADVLQSEHGEYFLHKRNRHMLVETGEEVPEHPDFHWLTLGQLYRLLHEDRLVNMDTRSVLACAPLAPASAPATDRDGGGVWHSLGGASRPRHTMEEVVRWLTRARAGQSHVSRPVPLAEVEESGWRRGPEEISRDGGPFRVVAVRVRTAGREVGSWCQPLVNPRGAGVSAFGATRFDGVLHVLAQAKEEPGLITGPEVAPTVQCLPGESAPFADRLLSAPAERIRFDTVLAEEGGRFLAADNRYLLVEDDTLPAIPPPGYHWLTLRQLARLTAWGHHVSVQARTLLVCALAAAADA